MLTDLQGMLDVALRAMLLSKEDWVYGPVLQRQACPLVQVGFHSTPYHSTNNNYVLSEMYHCSFQWEGYKNLSTVIYDICLESLQSGWERKQEYLV